MITNTYLPERVSLIKSPIEVQIQSNIVDNPDSIDFWKLRFDDSPSVGDTLQIVYNDVDVTYTFQNVADSSGTTLSVAGGLNMAPYILNLIEELKINYDIFLNFFITAEEEGGVPYIYIVPRERTSHALTLTESMSNVTAEEVTYSTTDIEAPGVLLIVEVYNHETGLFDDLVPHALPLYDPDVPATFRIEKDFDLEYELPPSSTIGFGGSVINAVTGPWTKYRLRWAEQTGYPPATSGMQVPHSNEYFALLGGKGWQQHYDDFWIYFQANGRFLTAQPKTKSIFLNQPEWLYWLGRYGNVTLHAFITATHRDGSTSTYQRGEMLVNKGEVVAIKSGFTQLNLPEVASNPIVSYTFVLRDDNYEYISEEIEYNLIGYCGANTRFFIFGNSLGGCDTLVTTGKFTASLEPTTDAARRIVTKSNYDKHQGADFDFNKKVRAVYEGAVGYYSASYIVYLQELIQSDSVWMINAESLTYSPIQIDADTVQLIKDEDDLHTLRFAYRHAWQDTTLALTDDGNRIIAGGTTEADSITIRTTTP